MKAGYRGPTIWVTITTAVVLTLTGGCWLVAWNAWVLMRGWRADVKVVVYLTDAASSDEVNAVRAAIASEPAVGTQRMISKAQAQEEFLRFMQLDRSSLEGLGENPFPASIEVSMRENAQRPEAMGRLASRWSEFPGVEEVRYGESLIRDLSVAARAVSILGTAVGVALACGVAVVIGVMVHISFRYRAAEVSLLRLFGASEGVIVKPFFLEGVTIGLLGGLIASALLSGVWLAIRYRWGAAFEGLLAGWVGRLDFPAGLLPGLIGLGILVGGIGSLVAVRRVRHAAP
ncbi:MAG: permease-like cell division protein FtsX [Nitrospirota bacterium]